MYLKPEELLDCLVQYSLNGKIEFPDREETELEQKVEEAYNIEMQENRKGLQSLKILYDEKEMPQIKYDSKDYYRVPPEVTIRRVSKETLGPGVLGVAYPGLKLVMVLDTLYGEDKSEVMAHEALHIMSPMEREMDIRGWTKQKLSYARYQ